jgi:NADH dehydrogenase
LPTEPFRYFDKGNLVTIGRANAVAEIGSLKLHGLSAWLVWLVVHITFLIGFRNRVMVMMDWAWAYLADQWEARLVLCDIERESRTSDIHPE